MDFFPRDKLSNRRGSPSTPYQQGSSRRFGNELGAQNKKKREADKAAKLKANRLEYQRGLRGNQVNQANEGYGSGMLADPSSTYTGTGSPDDYKEAGSVGYAPNTIDKYTNVALGELSRINKAPGSPYGYGTKESPFTGTASKPSGFFGAENSAEYAENTDNGRFISGNNELGRGAALSDLYRPEQMRQAAMNDITSDAYLAGLDQDKEQQRLQNFQRAAVRGRPGFRKLSQRRRSDQAIQAGEQMTDMQDRSSAERIMRGQNRVGMANAAADTQRGLAGQAKAQADIYDTDVTAGVELAKLEQEQVQYDQSRFSSPEQMSAHIISVLGKNDFPQALLNNRDFMDKLNMQVAQGADPEQHARIMMAQLNRGLGE